MAHMRGWEGGRQRIDSEPAEDRTPSMGYGPTHIRAALMELGRFDLAQIAFHNRGGWPSMDWCRFDADIGIRQAANPDLYHGWRMPNIIDVVQVDKAFRLWYLSFAPERVDRVGPKDLLELVEHTDRVRKLWWNHKRGECACPPRDYGRSPEQARMRGNARQN